MSFGSSFRRLRWWLCEQGHHDTLQIEIDKEVVIEKEIREGKGKGNGNEGNKGNQWRSIQAPIKNFPKIVQQSKMWYICQQLSI